MNPSQVTGLYNKHNTIRVEPSQPEYDDEWCNLGTRAGITPRQHPHSRVMSVHVSLCYQQSQSTVKFFNRTLLNDKFSLLMIKCSTPYKKQIQELQLCKDSLELENFINLELRKFT